MGIFDDLQLCINYKYYDWLFIAIIIVWIGLVWFNGISTIVGYLMPDPFLYI